MGLACAWFAAAEVLRRFCLASARADVIVVAAVATLLVATRLRSEFQMWQTDVPMMLLVLALLARWLGPSASPAEALAISLAVALIVVLAIAWIHGEAGVASLRWPSAGTQREQPYDGIVAIEWMALIVFALAFGPQTNPRHTSLLLMAATVLSALLCLSKAGVPRWPAASATAVLVFGLVFPPDLPGLEATLIWWRAVGGTRWCLVVMLPLLFLAGVSRVVRRDTTAPLGTPGRSEVGAWFGLSSTSRRR